MQKHKYFDPATHMQHKMTWSYWIRLQAKSEKTTGFLEAAKERRL